MILETDRLILRPWVDNDAEALFRYASDPAVGTPAGWPPHTSVHMSREVIRTVFSAPETYAIVLKSIGEPIGCCGIVPQNGTDLCSNVAEIGYWIGKPYWGLGIATEATKRLINHCFDNLGMSALMLTYYDGNNRSRRVAEKCGFRYVRTAISDNKLTHFTELKK